MGRIVLGKPTGAEKERHFEIDVKCSCGDAVDEYIYFDIYAETFDEIKEQLQEYFRIYMEMKHD